MIIRRRGQLLLFVLALLLTAQFLGTACAEDWTNDRSGGPSHVHDQLPSETEGLTETEDGEETIELEFAPVLGSPLHMTLQARPWCADHGFCPRETFNSDLFRPPIFPLVSPPSGPSQSILIVAF